MTNICLPALSMYKDVASHNNYRVASKIFGKKKAMALLKVSSRENARTPVQWSADANAGFTTGTPWLRVNPNYTEINVQRQENDPDSVLHCYRQLIRLRREYPVFRNGRFRLLLPEDENVFAYTREDGASELLVLCSFCGREIADPLAGRERGELLIANYPDEKPDSLRPYEARMYLRRYS